MRLGISLTIVAFLAMALAGCVGSDDAAPADDGLRDSADEAVVSATSGSIRGTVASDLFEPLGGAQVGIIETAQETKVARNGEFTMNDIVPGRYTLHIAAIGYQSAQRAVEVRAGEISEVTAQLIPAAGQDPYVEQRHVVDTISSGIAWHVEVPGQGCVVGPAQVGYDKTCSGLGGAFNNINVTPETESIIVEMVWKPAGPLGENFQLDIICETAPRSGNGAILDTSHPCYYEAPGRQSPLTIRADQTDSFEVEDYKWQGDWDLRVYGSYGIIGTGDAVGSDVGLTYEQKFEYFISVFYRAPAPDGYSGIPDQ